MNDELTRDLKANLSYHEHQAALIRERLAGVPAANGVAKGDACPECGERDADRLERLNDEDAQVRCLRCDFIYIPGG
ncbi:MAG: hypothetical protein ACF8R9_05480 [Phycisphaerales bacterium JB054]